MTLITNDIKVSVEAFYHGEHSRPAKARYVFSYRVTIENLGIEAVQLLRRHWYIFDSVGITREVEGEGVIGQQPIILPGETHQYTSWCPLLTSLGKMHGTFLMQRQSDGFIFEADIPEFRLMAPSIMN